MTDTSISNVNSSNTNTQNVNTFETNSKANQPAKEYSYGFRARLKSIGRYLTCGFSSSKRRELVIKEFANTSIADIGQLKNRSAEVKTALLTSDTLSIQKKLIIYNEYKTEIDTYIQKHKLEHPIGKRINKELTSDTLSNQQKLELYAQNRKAIDSYCQTAGIKNPLLGNSSLNDLEKITAQGIHTINFPTASNIEIFMNAFDAYLNKEFSAIKNNDNLDDKKLKIESLLTNLKQAMTILNTANPNTDELSFKQPIKKQHEILLKNFFSQALILQKATRMVMPMKEWLKNVNKPDAKDEEINGAWAELNKQIDLSVQKNIFKKINTFENFKTTLTSFNDKTQKKDDKWGINAMNMFDNNY